MLTKNLTHLFTPVACSLMFVNLINLDFALATNKSSVVFVNVTVPEVLAKGSKKKKPAALPNTGTVKKLVNGDLMCYVTLVDEKGKQHNLGADFSICEQEKAFLNKKVRLTYEIANVNDCQSAEPCGKTRKQQLISKMELVGARAKIQPTVGTIKQFVNGDLMCYVTLVDEKGKQHNLGASFSICEQEKAFLNKKVQLTYKLTNVNDCQSAEPCGKTRQENLISGMTLLAR